MPIPEKPESECSTVIVNICGEVKKRVIAKKREVRNAGMNCSNELAILKLILDK